ncbi:hypothetical protein [Lacrimispora saccharolytica]|uniref:Response regulatory domain-containing protein n=1 Tax=Lacrimispora saccharolytica (strain ATCC 35040 / DSM 2544 / NRCC 2533 / WM1) TaxID=610130 RepID=D9R7K2_LACSW|nr:hypothetical protein [Lacrimispora saccharolytica]ADL03731.1 hypothetical protein Closa_1115 [[Clostridium] saccharolyticum WM1]QRV18138.1 hypothetical protein I6K70_11200 [Lacrimispora saccharolytica]
MSENNPYVQNKIRVLIISDRLMDRAIELSNYLCSAGIHIVGLVKNKDQALEMVDQVIDFLIIAGYLENQQGYEIINEYRKRHKTFTAVHWAMLDSLISSYCNEYKIPLMFERTRPISDFVVYLQEHRPSCVALTDEELSAVSDENEQSCKHQYTLLERLKKYFWSNQF